MLQILFERGIYKNRDKAIIYNRDFDDMLENILEEIVSSTYTQNVRDADFLPIKNRKNICIFSQI